MSGLREIWQWVQSEVILRPENTVDREFERISKMFEDDNRSALADILRDDSGEFLNLLGSRLSELRDRPETDEDIITFEPRITAFERSITNILEGAQNLLRRIFG